MRVASSLDYAEVLAPRGADTKGFVSESETPVTYGKLRRLFP